MQIIDIERDNNNILEEDDPITDYDSPDSHIQLIQTASMQIMQIVRLKKL